MYSSRNLLFILQNYVRMSGTIQATQIGHIKAIVSFFKTFHIKIKNENEIKQIVLKNMRNKRMNLYIQMKI